MCNSKYSDRVEAKGRTAGLLLLEASINCSSCEFRNGEPIGDLIRLDRRGCLAVGEPLGHPEI